MFRHSLRKFSLSRQVLQVIAPLLLNSCVSSKAIEASHPQPREPASTARVAEVDTKPSVSLELLSPVAEKKAPVSHPALQNIKESEVAFHLGGHDVVEGTAGMVSSVEEAATRAGVSVLEAGGNAIDAAVATALALAVTHPSAGNIGGGGFMVAEVDGDVMAVDFREDAPKALTPKLFWGMIQGRRSRNIAVGVPGTVAGLYAAHQRGGKLPWVDLVAPAIDLAENGHIFGARQKKTLEWVAEELYADAPAREVYFPGWRQVRAGDTVYNQNLGKTLRRIAEQGPAGFYEGPTAEDIISTLGSKGIMTLKDLKNYKAVFRDPLFFDYRGLRVITMPSPSAGGVTVAQTMLMMEASGGYLTKPDSIDRYHYFIEATRRAQAERRFFVTAPGRPEAEGYGPSRWLDPQTWLGEFPIKAKRVTPSYLLTPLFHRAIKEVPHTTHFSVVDADGNAVSCTLTLSGSFGIRRLTKNTGIVLNNSVASFGSLGANGPKGGVRTVSSMAPTLVIQGGVSPTVVALGSPGGATIPSTVTQVLLHLTDGKSMFEAVNARRLHHAFVPDSIAQERVLPLSKLDRFWMRKRGHHFGAMPPKMGDANIVAATADGQFLGVSDWREGGLALGAKSRLSLPKQSTTLRGNLRDAGVAQIRR